METQAIELIKKGELRARREKIRNDTLAAFDAGEIDKLDIAQLGAPQIADQSKGTV
jgi:hypothetical protein